MAELTVEEQKIRDYFGTDNLRFALDKVKEYQGQLTKIQKQLDKIPALSPEQGRVLRLRDITLRDLLRAQALVNVAYRDFPDPKTPYDFNSVFQKSEQLDAEISSQPTDTQTYRQASSFETAFTAATGKKQKTATKPAEKPAAKKPSGPPSGDGAAQLRMIEEAQRDFVPPAGGGGGGGGATDSGAGGGRPSNPKKGDTWTGPKGVNWRFNGRNWVRTGKSEAGPKDTLAGIDVERLKADYPGYSWVFDLGPEFNDTKKILGDYLNGAITAERFNNVWTQSSWFKDQRTISETKRIKNRYGDILDGGTLSKLVNESVTFKYEDDELDTAFFNSALSRNVMTGEYVDQRAAKAAMSSDVANGYRNYAKSMFLTADDREIEDLLVGRATDEDFFRTKRQVAQATYKNWADLLNDPQMTMEKIVKPWKDMAASVLELDPNQVDMSKPQYSVAYAGSPDGKMGAMSLGDWYVKLRSDATYGWDKTKQAQQEARELGFNIARSFGRA